MSSSVMEATFEARPERGPSKSTPAPTAASPKSKLALSLRRGAAAGLRIVITAPRDLRAVHHSLGRFPDRMINADAQVYWETARRLFLHRSTQAHDRASWHVMVSDRDGRVVGSMSLRVFADRIVPEHMHVLTLATGSGPIFREQCELSVNETFAGTIAAGRMLAEISDCAIAPGAHRRVVLAMLVRATAALAAAFDSPLCVIPANQQAGEVAGLMRLGAAPLGRAGKFSLPPIIDHDNNVWLRLLLLDLLTFHARSRTEPAADLALLRKRTRIISAL